MLRDDDLRPALVEIVDEGVAVEGFVGDELEFGHFGLAGSPSGVDPERRLGGDVVERVVEWHGSDTDGT